MNHSTNRLLGANTPKRVGSSNDNQQEKPQLRIVAGPALEGWGSWQWLGGDLLGALDGSFSVTTFPPWHIPLGDMLVVIKHLPPDDVWTRLPASLPIVYMPIDYFADDEQIALAGKWLRRCTRIVIHCERLRSFFSPYAPVSYIDHPLKFVVPPRDYTNVGPIFWVGVRGNMPPLVNWVNCYPIPGELWVLTNPENPQAHLDPVDCGFAATAAIRMEACSREKHLSWASEARAAIDIKGADFRQRHKPAAKALDFVASGLPLAMNPDASAVEYLAPWGLRVCSPLDGERWLSRDYWAETAACGAKLREQLGRPIVATRFAELLRTVHQEARATSPSITAGSRVSPSTSENAVPQAAKERYGRSCQLAREGQFAQARGLLRELSRDAVQPSWRALLHSDQATLSALEGDLTGAVAGFRQAITVDAQCHPAREPCSSGNQRSARSGNRGKLTSRNYRKYTFNRMQSGLHMAPILLEPPVANPARPEESRYLVFCSTGPRPVGASSTPLNYASSWPARDMKYVTSTPSFPNGAWVR